MPLPDILQWLASGKHTGTLIISKGAVENKIFFREGVVLSSSSSDPTGFLGHFLVSKGVITEADLEKAVAVQAEEKKLLGEILVERGTVGQETLDRMLQLKAEENIYDLFAWEEGQFIFRDGELPDHDLVPLAADVTGLVLEGMQRLDEWDNIRTVIPSVQCVPVAVAPLVTDDELDLGWRGVLEAVNDDRSVEEICLQTHSNEFFVSRVLYQMALEERLKIVRPRIVTADRRAALGSEEKSAGPPSAETLVAEAHSNLRAGVYEPAARYLRAAASLEPHNRELALVVGELEGEIRAGLEADGVELGRVPVLETTLDDLRSMSFSPEEGFILSRINGTSDIASIIKISPLPELDSMLVFWNLSRSSHIRLEAVLNEELS